MPLEYNMAHSVLAQYLGVHLSQVDQLKTEAKDTLRWG